MATYSDKIRSLDSLRVASSGTNAQNAVDAIKIVPTANAAAANVLTITNASMGQASTVSVPDPGGATANVVLDTGTAATITATKLSIGATPVPQVDPAQCTVVVAAGASNTATITITLKDGSGATLARVVPFDLYLSDASTGIGITGTAASTGLSVASGGGVRVVTAVTKSIACVSSASGACVLSLLDTGKTGYYAALAVGQGIKVGTVTAGTSYGA